MTNLVEISNLDFLSDDALNTDETSMKNRTGYLELRQKHAVAALNYMVHVCNAQVFDINHFPYYYNIHFISIRRIWWENTK